MRDGIEAYSRLQALLDSDALGDGPGVAGDQDLFLDLQPRLGLGPSLPEATDTDRLHRLSITCFTVITAPAVDPMEPRPRGFPPRASGAPSVTHCRNDRSSTRMTPARPCEPPRCAPSRRPAPHDSARRRRGSGSR